MREKMKKILHRFRQYNTENMAEFIFGLSPDVEYDALVVAPSYNPVKLLRENSDCRVTVLKEHSYIAGYLVEKDGMKIAWIKVAAGAGNLIDHVALCAELKFRQMIFVGAVGALKEQFALGDLCTPTECISGGYTNTYLKDSLTDFVPFERVKPDAGYVDRVIALLKKDGYDLKRVSVFCTDSVALEYYHLEEIKAFGTDLIEMETASFYLMAELLEIPAIALLVVSDNSATGVALVGRGEAEQKAYDESRRHTLPKMIFRLCDRGAIADLRG